MKFLAITIFQFVSGSLYTDENLYHEDKADGKQGFPDVSLVRTVQVTFSFQRQLGEFMQTLRRIKFTDMIYHRTRYQ